MYLTKYCFVIWTMIFIAICAAQSDDFPTSKQVQRLVLDRLQRDETTKLNACKVDIVIWMLSLANGTRWALEMFDAIGKLPSGLLKGNINSLGQFDECISLRYETMLANKSGKYCVARIPLVEATVENEQNAYWLNQGRQSFDFLLGVCVPNSCTGTDIQSIMRDLLVDVGLNGTITEVVVPNGLCSTMDTPQLDAADIGAIVFFSFFVAVVLLSTLYDAFWRQWGVSEDPVPGHNILISFSMWTNTIRLLKLNPGSLKSIHGIRTITTFWIIISHRYVVEMIYPTINPLDQLEWLRTYGSMVILSGALAVDTFFFLSGMLVSYIFFKQMGKKRSFNIAIYYLHRILRLTPAMMAVVFFMATLYRHIGNGPIWHVMVDKLVDDCQNYWWTNLLYVHNYVNVRNMCLEQTWYLAVDMQLYLLSPILLYPLLRWKKIGLVNFAFWVVVALATLCTMVFMNEWPAAPIPFIPGAVDREARFYNATHTRAMPWLIGFGFGYLMYTIRGNMIKLNKFLALLIWACTLTVMGACVFGIYPMQQSDHVFSHWKDSAYNAFARSAWVICVAWVIFACESGYGGIVSWFLSWNVWELFGKFTYSMYLLHIPIQVFLVLSRRAMLSFSNWYMISQFCGDVFFSAGFGYLLTIIFESPILVLEKEMFHKKARKPENRDEVVTKST